MDAVDGGAQAPDQNNGQTTIGCGLTLGELRTANLARASEWNPTGKDLGGPFAACELAGEAGEAVEAMIAALGLVQAMGSICNATKKAERARAGIAGGVEAKVDLGRELADVVICADLIAMRLGVELGAAIVEKFNLTSREREFRTMLNGFGTPREEALRVSASLYKRQRDEMLALCRSSTAMTIEGIKCKDGQPSLAFLDAKLAMVQLERLGIDTKEWREKSDGVNKKQSRPPEPTYATTGYIGCADGGAA